ncbi:hypothetical protein [Micromonospora purpureochromogenes]|uniref:Uncharacterized protein n=1 Tax=Micromonospora purpureochromogenes TaxID=47872 RepID=A0ABX2RGI3_9ACTN|nr:hypothetical protein [Micromonospora purpureochromogenes]NYF54313.1 hypothetical protein [Micromonospora purpureochromogenes]
MTSRPGFAIRRHRDRRAPLAALVAAGAAVCLAAGTGVGLADEAAPVPPASWRPGCADGCATTAAPLPAPHGPPTRVRVARVGVDADLAVLGLDAAGQLVPPAGYDRPAGTAAAPHRATRGRR